MRASVRGEDEDNRRHDDAKNRKISVDAAVEGSGVWIGFGRHDFKRYKVKKVKKLKGVTRLHCCSRIRSELKRFMVP